MAMGVGVGAAIGIATHQLALWIGIGAGVGVALGGVASMRRRKACDVHTRREGDDARKA